MALGLGIALRTGLVSSMDVQRRTPFLLFRAGLATLLALMLALAVTTPAAAKARHPIAKASQPIQLPDGLRPEGITSGPGQRFYVGSLTDGRILTGSLKGGPTRVLLAGATGRSIRGLFYDARSKLVWAAGSLGTEAHVWAVHRRTGAVVSDTVVPEAVFLNDLVATRSAVWVTDSRLDRLTRIALRRNGLPTTGEAPTFLALRGGWPGFDGANIAANGVRALPDGSLILNHSTSGGLWRVDPCSGVATEIPVVGGPRIVGGDGLDRRGKLLINVRGGGTNQVSVLTLKRKSDSWVAVWKKSLTDPSLDVPSTATIRGNKVYAVNARFGVASPETAKYWVTPLKL